MTSPVLSDRVVADITQAMGVLPESFYDINDDACDCTFVRIGMWTNPYLGETLEVRMCCIWAELYKFFPQFVRVTAAFKDYNNDVWQPEVMEWNGETDMPANLWYRQLARKHGGTVAEMRTRYAGMEPPRGVPLARPEPQEEPSEPPANIAEVLFEMIQGLADEVGRLRGMVEK